MRTLIEAFQALLEPAWRQNRAHFKIHSSFDVVVPRGWQFENRRNEDLHMVFVRRGRGRYLFTDGAEPLHRGKIIFVSARCPHSAYKHDDDPPEIIPLRFGMYDNHRSEMLPHKPDGFHLSLVPHDISCFERLFEAIHRVHTIDRDSMGASLCDALVRQVLIGLYREVEGRSRGQAYDPRLERVRQHLETHPDDSLELARLAEIGGLSPKYLSRCFTAQYGMSPKEYRVRVKMNTAHFLVQHSGKAIKEIACDMGYADQYTFSKQFKKVFGVPPSEAKDSFVTPDESGAVTPSERLLLYTAGDDTLAD